MLDSVAIGGKDGLAASKGADEHEKARLRKMEVGEQGGDETELEAGGDKDLSFAGVGFERTARGLKRAVLQRADDRGTDGDDSAALADCAIDGVSGGGGERVALAVQMDLIDSLHTKRRKGAEAYVESEARDFDAASGERIEDLRGEMQASCGCGH